MNKHVIGFALIGCIALSSCSTVNYMSTDKIENELREKINHTTLLGKTLFKTDKKKKDTYENVNVYMNENEVGKDFEVGCVGGIHSVDFAISETRTPKT